MKVTETGIEPLEANARIIAQPLPWPLPFRHLLLAKRPECADALIAAFPAEIPAELARAVPSRKAEFLLGRLAAAALLAELGCPAATRWLGADGGRPRWPGGTIGSIAHSAEMVAVTACPSGAAVASVGIDIERLDQDAETTRALDLCFSAPERSALEVEPHGAIIGFALKEALFKCLNPLLGTFIEFEDVEARLAAAERAELVVLRDFGGRFGPGAILEGSYRLVNGHVWAGVRCRSS